MPYRNPEDKRAARRRYYTRNRDKILAQRRARRADLPPERLEELRARDRARHRRPRTASERAHARAATRRWTARNREWYAARRREKDRARYAAKRESILAARRLRYANDPAFARRTRETNQHWYRRNREQCRVRRKRYYAEHLDELRADQREKRRAKYAANPRARLDYYKQWRLRNLERARAYVRVAGNKRRAALAGTHFTFQEWEALLRSHDGRCAYCGSTERIEADHRTPLCRGGSNEIGNILPACRTCNRRKHRKTEEEFRALLAGERVEGGG
jgi:HNH endonuclease